MTRMAFWLLIISMSASAQVPGLPTRASGSSSSSSGVSDCAALDGGVCTTTAAMTLYVDPTGSDSNACTASGASACLTLAGAVAKVPRFVRHDVTVNVAAGAYAEPLVANDFVINKDITLTVQGTLNTFTPLTGASSGALTSVGATMTTTAPGTITDSTQAWTVDELKGAWIHITSGSFSGSVYPVISNTATTIQGSFNAVFTSGTTYTLVTMGSVFTSTSSFFYSVAGSGTLLFRNVRMEKSTANLWGNVTGSTPSGLMWCRSCDLRSTASSGPVLTLTGGRLQLTQSRISSVSTSGAAVVSVTGGILGTNTNNYVVGASGPLLGWAASEGTTLVSWSFELTAPGVNPVISITGAGRAFLSSTFTNCAGAPVGLMVGSATTGAASTAGFASLAGTHGYVNCVTAVAVRTARLTLNTAVGTALGIDSATTGISVLPGGHVDLGGAITPTFTGVTNELQVDGVNYPYSFLSGLSPGVIIGPYGSALYK